MAENEVKGTWGGARKGAGRPKGTKKDVSLQRAQHQVRAFEDEWEVIKAFAKVTKEVPLEECKQAIADLVAGKYHK